MQKGKPTVNNQTHEQTVKWARDVCLGPWPPVSFWKHIPQRAEEVESSFFFFLFGDETIFFFHFLFFSPQIWQTLGYKIVTSTFSIKTEKNVKESFPKKVFFNK